MTNLFYFGRMGMTIYKSSAGSGKTFTLVSSFLINVLEKPWLFNRILAITFTNKAATELKTRIIKELDILSKGLPSRQLPALREKLPHLKEETLRQNAGIVLLKIVHDYSSFSVSTIDSFFQVLARTLAREMLLPVKYEIELDTDSICKNVTELLLDEAGKNQQITQWLQKLLMHRMDSGKNWNIRPDLLKLTAEILESDPETNAAGTTDQSSLLLLIQAIKDSKLEIENTMQSLGQQALQRMKEHGYEPDTFYYKKTGPAGYLARISKSKIGLKGYETINKYTLNALQDPAGFLSKVQQKDASLLSFAATQLHPLLEKAICYFEENKEKYISVTEALKLIYQCGISGAVNDKLKEYREKNQLFHLSDTTRMLSRAISNQDASFIYEKSGNTYSHIFIDEFQDTSTLQWNILKPLIINSLSTGNDILIVGDAKQSIYRWRGGNIQLILEGIAKEIGAIGYKTAIHNLNTNWRSKKEIVQFNNLFFPLAATQLKQKFDNDFNLFKLAYAPEEVIQEIKPGQSEGGYVCFKFFEERKQDDNNTSIGWKTSALEALTANIEILLTRGYSFADIVILVRNNKDENIITDFFLENTKYPFISTNSLLISTNRSVRLLLNCMRLIANSDEAVLHAEINHFMQNQRQEETTGVPFSYNPLKNENNSWTQQKLSKERNQLLTLPLPLVFSSLLDLTNLNLRDPFLQKFYEIILEYAGSRNSNLNGFLSWYDEHVQTRNWSVDLPEGGNTIRILTIHKSKGLEFPVVFIPFMNWDLIPKHYSILWAQADKDAFSGFGKLPLYAVKDLRYSYFKETYLKETLDTAIDNLNLMYVAFTRPEEKLFVFGPADPKENEIGKLLMDVFALHDCWQDTFSPNTDHERCLGNFTDKRISTASKTEENIYEPGSFYPSPIPDNNNVTQQLPAIKYIFSSDESTFGNLVHEALSVVNRKEDIEIAVEKTLLKNGNQGYRHWKNKLLSAVKEIWDLLEKQEWTSVQYTIENEIEICDEQGMIHRPDKVLLREKEALIIDFKTGKREEQHQKQVKEYCRLIGETGINRISGYLIYTTEKEIVKVV